PPERTLRINMSSVPWRKSDAMPSHSTYIGRPARHGGSLGAGDTLHHEQRTFAVDTGVCELLAVGGGGSNRHASRVEVRARNSRRSLRAPVDNSTRSSRTGIVNVATISAFPSSVQPAGRSVSVSPGRSAALLPGGRLSRPCRTR